MTQQYLKEGTNEKRESPQEALSLHEEKAVLVLLKLFINCNERCHTSDGP